jgi:hypothetical protein
VAVRVLHADVAPCNHCYLVFFFEVSPLHSNNLLPHSISSIFSFYTHMLHRYGPSSQTGYLECSVCHQCSTCCARHPICDSGADPRTSAAFNPFPSLANVAKVSNCFSVSRLSSFAGKFTTKLSSRFPTCSKSNVQPFLELTLPINRFGGTDFLFSVKFPYRIKRSSLLLNFTCDS